ncbi:MAG: radical SAM protein [Kiritimatiellae bacterium]|nr:radical SAM protein [Kiritimatiellia bacterium]
MKAGRILLVKPAQLIGGNPMRFERALAPTRALPYIAALTPPEFEVSIVDDSIEAIDFDAPVDLVGITSLLPQVPRVIQIATEFRKRGVTVVAGGVGVSSVHEELIGHVDALVLGEADTTWPILLNDFKQGRLQKIYRAEEFFSMNNMPLARFDLLNQENFLKAKQAASGHGISRISVETSRGCPHNCAFCYSSLHFGRTLRFRPIPDVVNEVKKFPGSYIFFVDDNIGAQPARAKELFRALMPLNIRWVGQFSSLAAKDPELLDLAAQSGCMNAFVGMESLSAESLASVDKSFNLSQGFGKTLGAFRKAGIDTHVSLVFGFDGDTSETIDRTVDEMISQRVHLLYAFILTPLPGTQLHAQMKEEGRILHSDYSLYDTFHCVFRPKHMSPEELENKYWEAYGRFYSPVSIMRRFSDAHRWLGRQKQQAYSHNLLGNIYFRKFVKHRLHPLVGGMPKWDTVS